MIRKLASDLMAHGIDIWLDEWEIDVGEVITEKIQDGLSQCTHVGVCLTNHSVKSGWVAREWQAKIFQEITFHRIMVLPILLEDCEVPLFLSDKMRADFRYKYEDGFSQLVRALKKKVKKKQAPEFDWSRSISYYVSMFLEDLNGYFIPIPNGTNIKIVKSLKALPRSGKLLRLEDMSIHIPIRSVYDHILSVAHSADCLLPYSSIGLNGRDRMLLSRVIAYHDICEVLLGDVPRHTRLNPSRRRRANISSAIRLSELPNGEPERVANEFIGMFLHETERSYLKESNSTIRGNSVIKKYFHALDKIDPIIASWRYLFYFRENSRFNVDEFLERMRAFFRIQK